MKRNPDSGLEKRQLASSLIDSDFQKKFIVLLQTLTYIPVNISIYVLRYTESVY